MSSEPFNERMRLIRFRMKREKSRFSDEIRLVPRQLVWLVLALYAIAIGVATTTNRMGLWDSGYLWPEGARPGEAMAATAGVVTAVAIPIACVIFLIGYVNQDAKRRGMNAGLWTMLVIMLLPAWVMTGFIIYFLVREPLPYHCTQCGAMVSARFNYCPTCRTNLRPTCQQCKREVNDRDHYCPYCAAEVVPAAEPGPPRPMGQWRGEGAGTGPADGPMAR